MPRSRIARQTPLIAASAAIGKSARFTRTPLFCKQARCAVLLHKTASRYANGYPSKRHAFLLIRLLSARVTSMGVRPFYNAACLVATPLFALSCNVCTPSLKNNAKTNRIGCKKEERLLRSSRFYKLAVQRMTSFNLAAFPTRPLR